VARICIVTPGQLCSNPRAVKEAQALTDAGHEVTVICTRTLGLMEPLDRSIIDAARFRTIRLSFDNRTLWRLRRLRQVAAGAATQVMPIQSLAAIAVSAMTPRLMRAACSVRADLYIAHYVPALPAAARAAARYGARYAFDAEDFHPGDLPDEPRHTFATSLIGRIEGRFLPGAVYVTAASPLIARAYAAEYGIAEPTTILNLFPWADPLGLSARDAAAEGPSLYWFSQTIGPGRGLEAAVEAVARSRLRPRLYLRGTPAAGYAAQLRELAARLGASDQLRFLAPIAPADLEREGSGFDIGYAGELPVTRNRTMALTNKLFSYLTSGLAIVASRIPAHRDLAPQLGEAVQLFEPGDPASLADALDRLLDPRERLARARKASRGLARDRFNWEIEQVRLTRLVGEALR
jgi:glycosyltransferase involved in cell wall biosynthesis